MSFGEIVDICFTNGIHLKASAPYRMKVVRSSIEEIPLMKTAGTSGGGS